MEECSFRHHVVETFAHVDLVALDIADLDHPYEILAADVLYLHAPSLQIEEFVNEQTIPLPRLADQTVLDFVLC